MAILLNPCIVSVTLLIR